MKWNSHENIENNQLCDGTILVNSANEEYFVRTIKWIIIATQLRWLNKVMQDHEARASDLN